MVNHKGNGNLQPNARAREKRTKQVAFLSAYAEVGNITQAAKIAKVDRISHYNWLKKDSTYPDRFTEAHDKACDRLEQEARRRAVEGVEEPVFQKGERVGTIQRYSDKLLEFLLKGAKPQKYKTLIQQDTREERNLTVEHKLNLGNLSLDEQLEYCEILTKLLDRGRSGTRTNSTGLST